MVLYILRVRPAFHTSWMKLAQRNTHRVKENWRCTGAARVVFAFKPCDRSGRNAFFLSPDVSRADQESTLAWCGIGPTVLPLLDSQTPLARHSSTGGIQPRIYSLLIIPRNYARNGKRLRFRQSGGNRRYSGEYPPPRRIFVSFGSNIYIYIFQSSALSSEIIHCLLWNSLLEVWNWHLKRRDWISYRNFETWTKSQRYFLFLFFFFLVIN